MNTALILLAAGNSKRFGSKKLLYRIDGKTMLERAVDAAAGSGIPFAVVTQAGETAQTARRLGAEVIINRYPERGISSSLKLGLAHFPNADAFMFMVCDQPYLRPETISKLEREFRRSPKGIACLSHGARHGNPVIFDGKYTDELMQLEGDTGGRQIIKNHPEDLITLDVTSIELTDIDLRSDLNAIQTERD